MKDQFANNIAITKPSSGTRGLGTCLADATHAPKTAPFPRFARRPLKAGRYSEIPEGKLKTGARSIERQRYQAVFSKRTGHRFCSMVNLSSSVIFKIKPTGTIVNGKTCARHLSRLSSRIALSNVALPLPTGSSNVRVDARKSVVVDCKLRAEFSGRKPK